MIAMKTPKYVALAYYKFVTISDPSAEVRNHKKFFEGRDVSGRIYFSEEGVNGQMSASLEDAESYILWMKQDPRFADILFKLHPSEENVFPRMTVKVRRQLVALDVSPDVENGGEHVSPMAWKEMMESGEYLLLDVRNKYEWEIGHFEQAVLPPLETFREFPDYAEKLSHEVDPKKTKVMMYCTGGIRCELYSALLKEKGFDAVYQLDGGVINYGLEVGSDHWRGKLFVFDDRMAVPIDGKECAPIAHCIHCHGSCDTQYNCANMDCNALFVCCPSCLTTYQGCCSHGCTSAPRVRPIELERGNKPFRRKHLLEEASQAEACALHSCRSKQSSQA